MRIELPFAGQSYRHRASSLSAQTTRNWYPEINPETRAIVSLQPTPGCKSFCTVDNVLTTVTGTSRPADFWATIWGKTVVTVGPSGRDHTTIQAAYDAIVAGTYGNSSTEYVVLVDDGTYGALNTNGDTGRNIVWKSWGGAGACTISTTKPRFDIRGGKNVIVEGFTITASSFGWEAVIDELAGSLTLSKCLIDGTAYSGRIYPMNAGDSVTVTYQNCYCTTANPQVNNHEFTSNGKAATMALALTNSRIHTTGAISGAGGLTISTTGTNDTSLTSAVATASTSAESLPFSYTVYNKERDRGLNVWNGKLYSVSGEKLFEVSRTGTRTEKGDIPGSARAYFANESSYFVIVSGGRVFTCNGTSVTEVTDSDLESPQSVAYINRQAVYDGNGGRFAVSDVAQLGNVSALNFASAESAPDGLVRPYSFEQTLYLFGESTVESWYNSGAGNPPFDRIEGGILSVGLAARASVANTQNFIYFLGDDRNVYRMSRGSMQMVTNPAIAQEFAGYEVSDAIGFCYKYNGQDFYQLTFPGQNKTHCYSEQVGAWFELSSDMLGGRHLANSYAFCYGKHLVADYRNGNIYELDPDTYADNGEPVRRVRDTITIDGSLIAPQAIGRKMFMRSFELILDAGIGIENGQGSEPEVMMQFSDDGGRTWSPELWRKAGRLGQFMLKVNWHNLGAFDSRIMRIAVSDPIGLAIYKAAADIEVGF